MFMPMCLLIYSNKQVLYSDDCVKWAPRPVYSSTVLLRLIRLDLIQVIDDMSESKATVRSLTVTKLRYGFRKDQMEYRNCQAENNNVGSDHEYVVLDNLCLVVQSRDTSESMARTS